MATRRPPMPRSGSSDRDRQHEASPDSPQDAAASANTQQARPPASRPHSATPPVKKPAAKPTADSAQRPKVVPLGRVDPEAKAGVAGRKPAGTPPKPATAKPVAKPKVKATASQRRIEDRNLLSGAVRKDERAAQKSERKSPAGPKKPIPARSFSGRLLALSIALSVFAVLLVPSIGTYARQSDEIAALRTSIDAKQAEQEALKEQIARWDDPLYIKQQARDRINLVMPGERNYMVVGTAPEDVDPEEANQSPAEVRTDLPWVDALFDSVQRAATD